MKKHWWKALGAALVLYALTVGMLMPLHTGIETVSPQYVKTGDTLRLDITGYNTQFQKEGAVVRVWLRIDSVNAIQARTVTATSQRNLKAEFDIPATLPSSSPISGATLIVDNSVEGTSIMPSAVSITADTAAKTGGTWAQVDKLTPSRATTYPYRNILEETIRNTYYHVPLWFAMMILFIASAITAVRYLSSNNRRFDRISVALTEVGVLYGILGLITGAIWARYTWGQFWSFDVKQNMAAIAVLIYLAYFILRKSFDDPEKEARIGSVYNIFAFAAMIPLLFVIPRMWDSLHPGNGGNPALGGEDLDNTMRMVFYPAIIGFTLLGVWMSWIRFRMARLQDTVYENTDL